MKLALDYISINNFKSVGEPVFIDLTKIGPGLHFVRGVNEAEPRLGSNGAGKSTIWDGLSWCLFGSTPDGLRTPDIRPWEEGASSAAAKTVVQVGLLLDGNPHYIHRETNPNSIIIDEAGASQEDIEQLIGMNQSVFNNTVLLAQGQPLFLDLTPRDKMALFSAVLNLDKWEERAKSAKSKANELSEKRSSLEASIATSEAWYLESEERLAVLKTRSGEWVSGQRARENAREKEVRELKRVIDALQPELDEAEIALECEVVLKDVGRTLGSSSGELIDLERGMIRLEDEIAQAKTRRSFAMKMLKEADGATECPTCGQPVNPTDLKNHKAELARELKECDRIVAAGIPRKSTTALETLRKKVVDLNARAIELQDKFSEAQLAQSRLSPRIVEARTKLRALEAVSEEDNPYIVQIREEGKKIATAGRNLEHARKQMNEASRDELRSRYWVNGFKDVRLSIIEEVTVELQLATSALLEEMGLIGWRIEFAIEKETQSGTTQRGLHVFIHSPSNPKPVKWECWSGGEGQRLRIIGTLALADVLLGRAGIDPGFEVLDEPSRGLSVEGLTDLCGALRARSSSYRRAVFLTDHQVVEGATFTSTLTVVKLRDGGTQVKL